MSEDNQTHLNRFKTEPPNKSYIAGFIDGDGCIFIRKINDGYQSGITISQCRTNILQVLRHHFGGSITSSTNRNDKKNNIINADGYFNKYNVRNQYNLIIRNNEYDILLNYLQNSLIIKEHQYQELYKFNKIANLINKTKEKEQMYLICSQLNKKCNLDETYLPRLNIEYISGLFDAEGCLYINKHKYNNFYVSIAQKNHPLILHEIIKFLGFGKVCTHEIKFFNKNDCLTFLRLVKINLIVKYNQAIAFETFLTTNDLSVKEKMYSICNKEKHEIEIFKELNQNNNDKDAFLETLKLKEFRAQICKELHNKQVYKEKSEKMKGEGNHNYGKTFSEETKQKMSLSIREAKNGISDEIITQVRQLINEGNKNIDIQKMLGLPRHTITRIKNGDIVCRNEEKIEKKSLTQENVNLSKRKIKADEIVIVLEKLVDNWKPMSIFDYLIEERNKNNIPNTLTIDIIKNIKRNVSSGKTVIYESELTKEKYEYCMNIINNISKTSI